MRKFNQKLIIIGGITNGGKTLIFNLLRKEDNFISLDISFPHFNVYKDEIISQIGEENTKRMKCFMETSEIFEPYIFVRKIGFLMKKFPDYNFVIKPGSPSIAKIKHTKDSRWLEDVKKYASMELEDIHPIFAIRHPKMGWATSKTTRENTIDDFIETWSYENLIEESKFSEIVKIEDIKHNKLLKSLIKKTDLNKVLPYTKFDLQVKTLNNFDNLDIDFKKIEESMKGFLKYLNYDTEDENIQLFMNDYLSEEDARIDWSRN